MSETAPTVVLVVEDDESIANLLRINLELAGCKPVIAKDGEEAERKFNSSVKLVLLDLMLPGKDGWEVLEYIYKRGEGKIPVIITSAKTNKNEIARGFEMGIVDYVTKPFDPVDLAERIKTILRNENTRA